MSHKSSGNLAVVIPLDGHQAASRRHAFEQRLEPSFAMAKRAGLRLSVFAIRIDHEAYHRHEAGRQAFSKLFNKLHERLPEIAASAHNVGWPWPDGLAIVQSLAQDSFDSYLSAKLLLAKLKSILRGSHEQHAFKVSLGIALYPDDGSMPSVLLDRAYMAAQRADRWGRNGFSFYSRSVGREVAERLTMDVALMRALKAKSAELQFQPIIDLRQAHMIGVKGEPAWRHPERGDQLAEEIVHAVERGGMAMVYNTWLVELVCRQSSLWSRRLRHRRIGVEAIRAQLADAALATQLSAALETHKVLPDLIEVTIDAKLLVDGTDHRLRTGLRQLADLGVQLTAANLGAEPLSVEALATLPLTTVEFAPAMVSTIGRCTNSERALAALVDFTRALGLRTRAAGVTAEEQLEFLNASHCDEATGPLLAPPMKGDDIDRLTDVQPCLERSRWRAATERRLMHMH